MNPLLYFNFCMLYCVFYHLLSGVSPYKKTALKSELSSRSYEATDNQDQDTKDQTDNNHLCSRGLK